jgi:uncharacterized protein (TIGR03000 family)
MFRQGCFTAATTALLTAIALVTAEPARAAGGGHGGGGFGGAGHGGGFGGGGRGGFGGGGRGGFGGGFGRGGFDRGGFNRGFGPGPFGLGGFGPGFGRDGFRRDAFGREDFRRDRFVRGFFDYGYGLGLYGSYFPYGYGYPYYPVPTYGGGAGYSPWPMTGSSEVQSFYPSTEGAYPSPAMNQATAVPESSVAFDVRVPADAQIWFNGARTEQTGARRSFVSPALAPGQEGTYEMRVRWEEDGRSVERTRQIAVRAGDRVILEFSK